MLLLLALLLPCTAQDGVALVELAPQERMAWVEARLDAGARGAAEVACRQWASDAPEDPDAWALLARTVPDPETSEVLLNKALALDRSHPVALLGLGRLLAARGRSREALGPLEQALRVDDGSAEGWLLLARARHLTGDAPGAHTAATRAVERAPAEPEGWLLLARLQPDEGVATLEEATLSAPHADVWAALADAHLHAGAVDAAASALSAAREADPFHPASARLEALVHCQRAGALDPDGHAALARARRAALLGRPAAGDLVARYPACGMTWVARAAERRRAGDHERALQDLGQGLARMAAEPGAAAAYGMALLEAGRPAEARAWLKLAAARRPWDVGLLLGEADAHLALGERDRAVRVLEAALDRGDSAVAVGLAEALEDRAASMEILLAALARDPTDPALVSAARAVATSLGRRAEVEALVGELERVRTEQDAPPPHTVVVDGVEEIVVYGVRESDRLRELLGLRLQELGYGPGVDRGDATSFASTADRPSLVLRHDGLVELQQSGRLAKGTAARLPEGDWSDGANVEEVEVESRERLNHRKMQVRTYELLEDLGPQLRAWRGALSVEGTEQALQQRIPAQVDALWQQGTPLSGGEPLETPEARKAALLAYWSSRTCTPEGQLVRDWVARFLAYEVGASPWAVTEEEASRASAACPCDELILP